MSILTQSPSSEQAQAVAEFEAWLDSIAANVNPYDDEPPFDDGPIFEPDEVDLAWLREQQEACERLGIEEAGLADDIEAIERHLSVNQAARYLCRNREDDHHEFEARGAWGGHPAEGGAW